MLGCGSIGSRHARNAKSLGVADLVLVDPDRDRAGRLGAELGTDLVYADYEEAARKNPDLDAALICTPSSMHVKPAIFLAKRRVSLFIEKPLSDGLKDVSALKDLRDRHSLVVMMGHSFVFEEGFVRLREMLDEKVVGDVYFATYLQGHYLPDWHPKEDYRAEYTARSDLGGGALLTLASHSLYIIDRMLGPVASIRGAFVGRRGDLEVDVDDSALMLLETEDGIPVQTLNNFITRVHQHRLIIEGSKGVIEQDFANQRITVTLRGKEPDVIPVKADNNTRFMREMEHFLRALKEGRIRDGFRLEDGIRFLKIAEKARRRGRPLRTPRPGAVRYWKPETYYRNAGINMPAVKRTISDIGFDYERALVCGRGTGTHPGFKPRISTPTTDIESDIYVNVDHSPGYVKHITRPGKYAISLIVDPAVPKKITEVGGEIYWFAPSYMDLPMPSITSGMFPRENSGLAGIALAAFLGAREILLSGIHLSGGYAQFLDGKEIVFNTARHLGVSLYSTDGRLCDRVPDGARGWT